MRHESNSLNPKFINVRTLAQKRSGFRILNELVLLTCERWGRNFTFFPSGFLESCWFVNNSFLTAGKGCQLCSTKKMSGQFKPHCMTKSENLLCWDYAYTCVQHFHHKKIFEKFHVFEKKARFIKKMLNFGIYSRNILYWFDKTILMKVFTITYNSSYNRKFVSVHQSRVISNFERSALPDRDIGWTLHPFLSTFF